MNKTILIPKELDLKRLVEDLKPDFDYKIDIFYYLIWYILRNPYFTSRRNELYTSLCANGLQNNVHRDYRKYLDVLDELGLVLMLRQLGDGKCDLYRLADDIFYNQLVPYAITDWALMKKMFKESKLSPQTLKKYKHLTKFLLDGDLKLNIEWAKYDVHNDFMAVAHEKRLEDVRRYHNSMISIKYFQDNYMWITNNPKTDNRLHTNFSNMPKRLRKHLEYNGERLVSVDVQNSQPLLLGIVINTLINNLKGKGINRKLWEVIQRIIPNDILINIGKVAETIDTKEFATYHEWVMSGIYEKFGEKYIEKYPTEKPPYIQHVYDSTIERTYKKEHYNLRDYIKVGMFEIYFSSNHKQGRFKTLFSEIFPSISALIREIKIKDYVLLSRLMQSVESYIVLEYATKRIYEDYGIMQLTIHDSIWTTPNNLELIKKEFQKHFADLTGITPVLKPEDWCKDCEDYIGNRIAA